MVSSQSLDLLEHFKQDAVVTDECTTHIEYKADRIRGIRREKVEKRWYREQAIGHGSFGDVWLEVRREDSDVEKRAVKVMNKGRMQSLGLDYKKELLALAKFSKLQYQQEQVLVEFFGWFENPSHLFLSMEYFELGDLERHITGPITEDDMKDITTDLLNGLRIMHSENFAHRDLKPANIFVVQKPPTASWWVKIGDFGISKRVRGGTTELRTQAGTRHYQAPEINGYLDTDEPTLVYDNTVDMWSLGCVIYKIATQSVPFPKPRAIEKFCDGSLPFPEQQLSERVSMDGVEFIKRLVVPNPHERLSAASALRVPWLLRRERNAVPETEDPRIAQATTLKSGSPKKTAASLHSKELTGGVTHSYNGSTEAAEGISNERERSSDDETIRPLLKRHALGGSPNGELVAHASDDGTAGARDLAGIHTLEGHSGNAGDVAFSLDGGLVASTSDDGEIRIWHSATGGTLQSLRGHSNHIWAVAFSLDGKQIASASEDGNFGIWKLETGVVSFKPMGYSNFVTAVAFSPDSKLVALAFADTNITLRQSATGMVSQTLKGHSDYINAVAFSPDGKLVASASADTTVRLWDPATGDAYRTLEGQSIVWAVAFSPDGKLLASAYHDANVTLWDSATGLALHSLKGHSNHAWAVAFSPNGKLVASASADMTIRLWDSATGEACRTLKGHSASVWAVAFSPDGKLVISVSLDRTVRHWDTAMGAVEK